MPEGVRDGARDRVRDLTRRYGWDLLGCVLGVLYAVPSLVYPFGADQGIHWYVGFGWLHGEMPYATGISGKPPGIFVVHALASALFGGGQSAIRVLELLTMPALGYLVANVARQPNTGLAPGAWGASTLLVSAVNYTYADYWNTAHPELWEAFFLLLAMSVALHQPNARVRALLAGALCMAAFVLKYPAASVALVVAGWCGLRALREQSGRRVLGFVEATAFYVLGMALVLGITLVPFVFTGTFDALLEVCVDMTERYVGTGRRNAEWWPGFWKWSRGGTLLLWFAVTTLTGLAVIARRANRDSAFHAALLLCLLSSAIGGVVLQGRNWSYHWVTVFPFLVVLGVWGIQHAASQPWMRLALSIVTAATLFWVAPHFVAKKPRSYRAHVDRWWDYAAGRASAQELQAEFERLGEFDKYAPQQHIGQVARRLSQPGDTLCVRGFISSIYQVSGMRCSSRHAIQSFVGLGPPSWKTEYARDMRERPPRFMVTFADRGGDLRALARQGYRKAHQEGGLVLMRRN